MSEVYQRLGSAESKAADAMGKIVTHEAVCAERYEGIKASISSLNHNLRRATWTLLGGMGAILVKMAFFT